MIELILNRLAIFLVISVVGSLLGAVLLRIATYWVCKFIPSFRHAYLACFFSCTTSYLTGLFFFLIITTLCDMNLLLLLYNPFTSICDAAIILPAIVDFFVSAAIIGIVIKDPQNVRITYLKACLINLIGISLLSIIIGFLFLIWSLYLKNPYISLILLLSWFVFGIIIGYFAKQKNRNPVIWGIIGGFFSIPALIAIIYIPYQCPNCKKNLTNTQWIEGQCPGCNHELKKQTQNKNIPLEDFAQQEVSINGKNENEHTKHDDFRNLTEKRPEYDNNFDNTIQKLKSSNRNKMLLLIIGGIAFIFIISGVLMILLNSNKKTTKTAPLNVKIPIKLQRKTLLKKAKAGNINSLRTLAKRYYFGKGGFKKNYYKAFEWALKGAEAGDAYLQYLTGNMYANGHGAVKDKEMAYDWYVKSIPKCKKAYFDLAKMSFYGIGTSKDITKFFYYIEKAEKFCNKEKTNLFYEKVLVELSGKELYDIAEKSLNEQNPKSVSNYSDPIKLITLSAEKGYLQSIKLLGNIYYYGKYGTANSYRLAYEWYLKAAEKGDSHSQYMVGIMDSKGQGVEKNYKKAFKCFKKSAAGTTRAYIELSNFYFYGRGTKQSYIKAFYYLDESAKNENTDLNSIFIKYLKNMPPKVILQIADMYYSGKELTQNYKKAFELYKHLNNKNGEYMLSKMFFLGQHVEKNLNRAIILLTKAITQGKPDTDNLLSKITNEIKGENLFRIAEKLEDGSKPFPKNKKLAYQIYKISATKKNIDAILKLAKSYYNGNYLNKNYKKAFHWYKAAANQNNSHAIYILAKMYFHGQGTEKNIQSALHCCKRAAIRGNVQAQNLLGCMLTDVKNYEDAFYWFRNSAKNGNINAQINLSKAFFYGKGTKKSYIKSFYWLDKAIKNNNLKAESFFKKFISKMDIKELNILADSYYNGTNLSRDYQKALMIYKIIAAKTNDPRTQFKIGDMYYNGYGVKKNMGKSFNWFKKSAVSGNAYSQARLSLFYYDGLYVKQSYPYAYAWLKIAKENGNKNAGDLLSFLNKKLKENKGKIAEAKKCYEKIRKNLR
ncbi:MAG: sel1 repeat family protein [Victivallales bacterium]|nr:sel1 repeat family protein [Victivallales bacterium]